NLRRPVPGGLRASGARVARAVAVGTSGRIRRLRGRGVCDRPHAAASGSHLKKRGRESFSRSAVENDSRPLSLAPPDTDRGTWKSPGRKTFWWPPVFVIAATHAQATIYTDAALLSR